MIDSLILDELCATTGWHRKHALRDTLHDYQRGLGAAYLLFTYMDFIQRAGELLRQRLGGRIAIRDRMDTHPRASARLERLELMNLGEHLYTSPLVRATLGNCLKVSWIMPLA